MLNNTNINKLNNSICASNQNLTYDQKLQCVTSRQTIGSSTVDYFEFHFNKKRAWPEATYWPADGYLHQKAKSRQKYMFYCLRISE